MSTRKITKVQKEGETYDLSVPGLEEALATAEQAKNDAQAAATSAGNSAALAAHLLGLENVPLWAATHVSNPTATGANRVQYYKDDLVRRTPDGETKDHVYRAKNDIMYGASDTYVEWDDDDWIDTSVWKELRDMRLGSYTTEHVRVFLKKYNFGVATPVSGATVTVSYDGNSSTYTSDSDGTAEFDIPEGKSYAVSVSALAGYYLPAGQGYTANMSSRNLQFNYSLVKSGLYIIDNNGAEYTLSAWQAGLANNTLSNTNAKFIKYYTASGHFAIAKQYTTPETGKAWAVSPLNSILLTGDAAYAGNDTATYKYGNEIANGGHTTTNITNASNDFDMIGATTQIISLGRLWQSANGYENTGTEMTIYSEDGTQQVPLKYYTIAACHCRTKTETLNGHTLVGHLPPAGILAAAKTAQALINEALNVIKGTEGTTYLNFGSGYWWSSTQYNAGNAWFLGNGALNGTTKTVNNLQVLPFFDLSDIN